MEINVLIDEGLEGCLEASWLQKAVEKVSVALNIGSATELGLVIATQEKVQELNRRYRGKDRPTDVLAFAMLPAEQMPEPDSPPFIAPPDGVSHLGEVIISYPQAVIQASEHQHSVEKELTILIIHGILHLLGYDDEKPQLKRQMQARETEILNYIETQPK